VPGASYKVVTGDARPGRILLAEQQVLSASPRSQHSNIGDFVSHPNDKFSGPPQAGRCNTVLDHLQARRDDL